MSKSKNQLRTIEGTDAKQIENAIINISDPSNLVSAGTSVFGVLSLTDDMQVIVFKAMEADKSKSAELAKQRQAQSVAQQETAEKELVITETRIPVKELFRNQSMNVVSKLQKSGSEYSLAYSRNIKRILQDNEDSVIEETTKAVRAMFDHARKNPACNVE